MNIAAFVILVLLALGQFIDFGMRIGKKERDEFASTFLRALLLAFCAVAMGLNI